MSKNHRDIPTGSLWRPSIHDCEPKPKAGAFEQRPNITKKSATNLAGRYMIMIRNREPDLKGLKRNAILAHCCRVLRWFDPPGGAYGRLKIFQAYAAHRGYKLTTGKKARLLRKAEKMKAGSAFYDSREWLTLRYKALKLYGRKCMACGETGGQMHVDHIKPRSKYPELELELSNLQVLCRDCNLGKSNWDETDWRPTETQQ